MIFTATAVEGVHIIDLERLEDERGFFARVWCSREFQGQGLDAALVQCSISFNKNRGTLRGMHYQTAPHAEAKVVRCTQGVIHDVVIDLRPESPTYRRYVAVQLSAVNRRMLYIPKGVAHGFLTLENDTEVFYQMSEYYAPESASGVRWNDPAFNIEWPGPITTISKRDQDYPDFLP